MLTINFLFILRKSANYSVNRFFFNRNSAITPQDRDNTSMTAQCDESTTIN